MILAIFVIAVLLIAGGLLGFYGAINLIPTDLGLAYFHAGTLSLVAGLVTMALGFAARANGLALRRIAMPAAIVAPLPPAGEAFAPQPEPARVEAAPRDLPLAGAAVAGAALAVSSLQAPASPADDPARPAALPVSALHQTMLDLPPVDLPAPVDPAAFAAPEPEAVNEQPEVATPEQPASDESVTQEAFTQEAFTQEPLTQEPTLEEPTLEEPTPDTLAQGMLEPMAANPATEAPAAPELVEPPVIPSLPPIPDLRALRLDPIPGPPLLSIEEEIRAELNRKAEPVVQTQPAQEPEPAPVSPVPGLIADADLAALEQTAPPLAPLETLEIVGSYDSGGTRFTMYSDGSVVASGPEGETRYPTLQALRRHLDQIAG
jgi:hypothetical protein